MYDASTIELALEMGLDPGDFSVGTSDPFADDSGVQQNRYPPQYNGFQDDIGEYMRGLTTLLHVSEDFHQKILLPPLQNVV